MQLPIGYQTIHRTAFFNYQLNRLRALGYARDEDLHAAAATIRNRADYVAAFTEQAARAKAEGRMQNAAFYLRAVEFFTPHDPEQRNAIYADFLATFDEAFAREGYTRHAVPYAGSHLPALELNPGGAPKGTVLVMGGFDSLIEEFLVIWRGFAEAGYRVIAFEGPGQGGALRLYGHTFDHDYEKPVAAILDHFGIAQASLVGISMGGYWAARAAAYEPRIQQLVLWPPVYDWLEQLPGFAQPLVHFMVRFEGFMNFSIRVRTALVPILDHAVKQAMYQISADQPMDAVRWLMSMNREHISSARISQDVLLLGGEKDTFQPLRLLRKQQAALVNARSVTTRIFTAAEHAGMHCQMGNLNLAIDTVVAWLDERHASS